MLDLFFGGQLYGFFLFFVSLFFSVPTMSEWTSRPYFIVKQSPCGQASMTGHEGKKVTGSLQYCAVNKSPCGQASMTGHEGK